MARCSLVSYGGDSPDLQLPLLASGVASRSGKPRRQDLHPAQHPRPTRGPSSVLHWFVYQQVGSLAILGDWRVLQL